MLNRRKDDEPELADAAKATDVEGVKRVMRGLGKAKPEDEMNGNVIRTITIRGTSEGLDKLQADLNKLAAAQKDVAVARRKRTRSTLSLEQAWKRQTLQAGRGGARAGTTSRARRSSPMQALREGVADPAAACPAAGADQPALCDGIDRRRQKFGQQTGLARHELINLGRQAQDVGVSLASGQSPLMVLVQQGSQIADVFVTSGRKSAGSSPRRSAGPGVLDLDGRHRDGHCRDRRRGVYAASQFVRASTTIEQALEEQNRLLKEGKALIDAKASAEARAQLRVEGH